MGKARNHSGHGL